MSWNDVASHVTDQVFAKEEVRGIFRASPGTEGIDFCLKSAVVTTSISKWLNDTLTRNINTKSFKVAENSRIEGNKLFSKGCYDKAIEHYNASILYSCDPIEEATVKICVTSEEESRRTQLSLAYANRSAAYFHMNKFEECLMDIKRAFEHGYPDRLKHKLVKRRKDASHGRDCKLSSNIHGKPCNTTIRQSNCTFNNTSEKLDRDVCVSAEGKLEGENRQLPHASRGVDCKYNREKGRYLVANDSIKKGTTIISERPYASVLLPQWNDTHCHNCYRQLSCFVPCRRCSLVRFCSEKCREAGWETYHNIECSFLPVLHEIGIAHLAIRIVIVTGFDTLLSFGKCTQKDIIRAGSNVKNASVSGECELPRTLPLSDKSSADTVVDGVEVVVPGFGSDGVFRNGYHAVFSLVSHTDETQEEDLFLYCVMATLLLKILDCADFFRSFDSVYQEQDRTENGEDKQMSDSLSDGKAARHIPVVNRKSEEIKVHIGSLLCHHIQQLICNAHAITDINEESDNQMDPVMTLSQERIATGIYLTASLMNHSCEPSIISSFIGDRLIVRTIKNMAAGDEIFNCYGPHYQRMQRDERIQSLKQQYHFTCSCPHCVGTADSSKIFGAYKCKSCQGILLQYYCATCDVNVDASVYDSTTKEAQRLFNSGMARLKERQFSSSIAQLEACLRLRQTVLYKNNTLLGESFDAVSRCHAHLGDYKSSLLNLDRSMIIVGTQYGYQSVEYSRELVKHVELTVNLLLDFVTQKDLVQIQREGKTRAARALQNASACRNILVTHFGTSCELIEDLKDKEEFLQNFLGGLRG